MLSSTTNTNTSNNITTINPPQSESFISLLSTLTVIVQFIGVGLIIFGFFSYKTISNQKKDNKLINNILFDVNLICSGIYVVFMSLLFMQYLRQCKLENSEYNVYINANKTRDNYNKEYNDTKIKVQQLLETLSTTNENLTKDSILLSNFSQNVSNFNRNFRNNLYYIPLTNQSYLDVTKTVENLTKNDFTTNQLDITKLISILQNQQSNIQLNNKTINNTDCKLYIKLLKFYYQIMYLKCFLPTYSLGFQIPNITDDGVTKNYYCGDVIIKITTLSNSVTTSVYIKNNLVFNEINGINCSYGIQGTGLPLNTINEIQKKLIIGDDYFILSYGNRLESNATGINFINGLATNNVLNKLIINSKNQLFVLEFEKYCLNKINIIDWNNGIFLHYIYDTNSILNLISGDFYTYNFNDLSINLSGSMITISDFTTYNFLYKRDTESVFIDTSISPLGKNYNITTGYYYNNIQFFSKDLSPSSLSNFFYNDIGSLSTIIQN